ncbi:MAG: hypothetical protein V8Q83_07890 [Blautia sp.]
MKCFSIFNIFQLQWLMFLINKCLLFMNQGMLYKQVPFSHNFANHFAEREVAADELF